MRVITLLIMLAGSVLTVGMAAANDDNLPDTLKIDKIEVEKGGPAVVKVEFVNDEELAALTIPLAVVGGLYKIDSVSFTGSRVEYLKMRPVTIAEDKSKVVFGAICMTEDYIPAGKGLMATIFLSPSKVVSPKADFVVIDTTTIGPASMMFTKISSASFIPEFSAGMISHKKPVKKDEAGQKPGKEKGQ
jgi:hypothetical protein